MVTAPETCEPATGELSFSATAGFVTVTLIEGLPNTVLFAANAVVEMVWTPLANLVVFQVMVEGGVLA